MNNGKISHSFSERLQEQCLKKGLSAEGLISAIQSEDENISRETIRSWYYKDHLPRIPSLKLLCDILDCDADYLIDRREETTHDRTFIRHETGLSEEAIIQLQKATDTSIGNLFHVKYKPLGAAVNYLLTNEHGLSLLQCIYDYINSDAMTLSYQGKEIEEDIVVSNSRTQNTYSIAHNEYDAVLLTQIQQELVLLKHNAAK